MLPPLLVSPVQERLDGLAVCTRSQLLIVQTACQVFCRIHIGMSGVPADHTAKRLLVWAILAGHRMAAMALLGTVSALDLGGTDAAFGGTPGQLRRDVGQIGGLRPYL